MKFYMHQRIIGENLIKIGLILSAQWRFSEERYQACPVTLKDKFEKTINAPHFKCTLQRYKHRKIAQLN